MRLRSLATLCALSLCSSTALAQIGPSFTRQHRPAEVLVDVYSGHGDPGALDSEVSVLVGPSSGFAGQFSAADFAAARAGAPAPILANPPWVIQGLTTNPNAHFIAPDLLSESGLSQASGLFAIEFDVPTSTILQAEMDFYFSSDDYLGWGQNKGVFINGMPVKGTETFFGHNAQFLHEGLPVGKLLKPGKNWMYVYLVNTGGPGGIIWDARIRIHGLPNDECDRAFPAYVGQTKGTTKGLTTSAVTGSCGMLNDAWFYFVPPETGQLDMTLTSSGANFQPQVASFLGECGQLSEVVCTPVGAANFSLPVIAGNPMLLAVGGATPDTGNFTINLELTPSVNGLVYPGNGHLYLKSPTVSDFQTARAFATQQGGYLASINDAAENAWIQAQMASNAAVWIGLTDEVTEGTFLWESGEPFSFDSWNSNEPNDAAVCNGEDYVEMLGGSGKWNDLNTGVNPCGNHIRFGLVEIPATGLASLADLGGNCGPAGVEPVLYSQPHQLGQSASMAVLNATPTTAVVLYKSAAATVPTPIGDCVLHLDVGTSTVMASWVTSPYGSAAFSFPTPNDPLLIGVTETWQAQLFTDGGAPQYTNAIESTLGN